MMIETVTWLFRSAIESLSFSHGQFSLICDPFWWSIYWGFSPFTRLVRLQFSALHIRSCGEHLTCR